MRRYSAVVPSLFVSMLIILATQPAMPGPNIWTISGLQGHVSRLAIAPSNPSVLYAYHQDENAVLKSTDAGRNWTPILTGVEVGALSVHPSNPDIVLAASNAVVFRSIDGGITWGYLDLGWQVFAVQFHPANPDIIDLLGWDCIYRSVDGGTKWRDMTPGICFT